MQCSMNRVEYAAKPRQRQQTVLRLIRLHHKLDGFRMYVKHKNHEVFIGTPSASYASSWTYPSFSAKWIEVVFS